VVKVVWVVRGVLFVFVDVEVLVFVLWDEGRVWMPRDWAAGVWVRKAKGAVVVALVSAGDVELLVSRFVVVGGGWRRERKRAICVSLRVFSAMRAAFSFWVSMSLRRRV
jgi:hypothetical protein